MDGSSSVQKRVRLVYADASGDLAMQLGRALEAAGFALIDAAPPGGGEDAVIVCWTPAGVASDRVNLEAARARKARTFTPILLAPCSPPGSLGQPLADLSGWHGDAASPEFRKLVQTLHARLSKRMFSGDLWRSRYLSWGGIGAAALGGVAIIANLGDLGQTIDGALNPAASERALNETNARVEEVLVLLKQKSGQQLSSEAEAALRGSIQRLLDAQDGARGSAAQKLADGDVEGALADLNTAAIEGERAAAGLAETWQEIGALAFMNDTFTAMDAYRRATELAPGNIQAQVMLGSLYMRTGRFEDAQRLYQNMLYEAEDDATTARALASLGVVALARDDLEQAEMNIRDSLEINEKLGNVAAQAQDLNDLGDIYRLNGDFSKAEQYMRRALQMAQDTKHIEGEANVHLRLGGLEHDRRRLAQAASEYTRSREISESIGDKEGMAAAINSLAAVELDRGRIDAAKTLLDQSLQMAQDVSARESEAYALGLLGEIAEKRGDKITAINNYRDAMVIYRQNGQFSLAEPFTDMMKALGAAPHPEGPEN
jgi:tetratricopeptide (TPR) repeat protein